MTNKEFQKALDKAWHAANKANILYQGIEAEYERRYGYNPSDIDDDSFIDSYLYCHSGKQTVLEVAESAELHLKLKVCFA